MAGPWLFLLILASSTGCLSTIDGLKAQLASEDARIRIHAMQRVAGDHREPLFPALVDQLEHDDPAVRMFAILSLERVTGTRLGYDYAASKTKRGKAVESWRDYFTTDENGEP